VILCKDKRGGFAPSSGRNAVCDWLVPRTMGTAIGPLGTSYEGKLKRRTFG
jgi:hypothetical protein